MEFHSRPIRVRALTNVDHESQVLAGHGLGDRPASGRREVDADCLEAGRAVALGHRGHYTVARSLETVCADRERSRLQPVCRELGAEVPVRIG